MALTAGAITCRSYIASDSPASDFMTKVEADLKRHAFRPVRVDRSPRSLGWVNARNVLDTDLTGPKVIFEDYLLLGLRLDRVTVNARLLKAYFHQARIEFLHERRKKQLSREERATLLEKVKLDMMANQTPATSLYEMAWNTKTSHVYFSATSTSLNQEFCDLFSDTFHTALTPLLPYVRADMKAQKEGLTQELLTVQAVRFSPRGTVIGEIG
jgi:hypothetical protein